MTVAEEATAPRPLTHCHRSLRKVCSWTVASAALLSLGIALLAWGTAGGAVVARDSLGYFGVVESWCADGCLSASHWPPGYPLLLVLAGAGESDPVQTAARINLIAFAISGVLMALLMRAIAGVSLALGLGGLALVMVASVVLDSYRYALTEPVFLAFQIAACLFTVDYMKSGRAGSVAFAGAIVGGTMWFRYAGAFLIPSVVLAPWFRTNVDSRTRCAHSVVSAAAAIAVVGALGVVLAVSSAPTAVREIVWHPVTRDSIRQLGVTFLGWGLPSRWLTGRPLLSITGGILCVVLPPIAAYVLWWRHRVAAWFAAQATLYLLGLIISISVADHATPLDARILLPMYVAVVCCGVATCTMFRMQSVRVATGILLLALGAVAGLRSLRYMGDRRLAEDGYNTSAWRADPAVRLVRALPRDWTVIGNPTGVLEFHAKRTVYGFPQRYDAVRALETDGIGELLRCVRSRDPSRTLLVYYASEGDPRDESPADVARALGLNMQTNVGRAALYTRSGLPLECGGGRALTP